MKKRIQILLQTTIPAIEDNWNINRFSLLRDHLSSLTDGDGRAIFEVTARDRETNENGYDKVLSILDDPEFDVCHNSATTQKRPPKSMAVSA